MSGTGVHIVLGVDYEISGTDRGLGYATALGIYLPRRLPVPSSTGLGYSGTYRPGRFRVLTSAMLLPGRRVAQRHQAARRKVPLRPDPSRESPVLKLPFSNPYMHKLPFSNSHSPM